MEKMSNLFFGFIVFSSILFCLISGSTLTFQSSPNEIHANLTRSLRMRCGVNGRSIASGSIVGRSISQSDVTFVTSLVVMRDGLEIASVTEHTAASATQDLSNIKVEGKLTPNSDEAGYIELTWSYPNSIQSGEYSCEVNGISSKGHNVMLSKTFEVTASEPTQGDLVNKIHVQDIEIQDLKQKVSQMMSEHTESGFLNCGGSKSWTDTDHSGIDGINDGYTHRYKQVTQQFQKAYSKPPVVHLGIRDIYAKEESTTYFQVKVDSVTETSFTMSCRTIDDERIYQLAVSWISTSA